MKYALLVPFNRTKGAQVATLELDTDNKVHETMLLALATHGLKQKANDSYAQLSADDASDAECLKEFMATVADIQAGNWSVREGLSTLEKLVRKAAEKAYKPINGVKWSKATPEMKKAEYAKVRANSEAFTMLTAMAKSRDEEEALLATVL